MSTQTQSVLDPLLTYDFLFEKDTKLDYRDNGIESDVYQIRIFGNEHHIVIGNNHKYPEKGKENITYFIVYLLYELKVVCKIGIYEIDTETLGEDTNRTFDFTKQDLLLAQSFYKNPDRLNPFIVKEQSVAAKEEPESKEEPERKEEEPVKSPDFNEWLIEEGHSPLKGKTPETQNSFLAWLKNADNNKGDTGKSKRAMNNIFTNIKKVDTSLDNEYTDYLKPDKDNKKQIEFHHDSFFEDKTRPITRSILILFEYLLDIKCVEVDSNEKVKRVTFLNDLTDETINNLFFSNKSASSLRANPVFKKYNPTKIVLVKEDTPNSYSMVKDIELVEDGDRDETLLSDIKSHLLEKPNEYINDKTVIGNMKKLRTVLAVE